MDDVQQRLAQMEATISSQPPHAPQASATPSKASTGKAASKPQNPVETESWSLWQWALVGFGVLVVGTIALQLIRVVMGLLGLVLFVAVAYFAYRFFTRSQGK